MGKSPHAERNPVSFTSATRDADFVAEWQAEQDRCLCDIERHQGAERSYLEEGVRFIEQVQNAWRLFEKQNSRDKRHLPKFLVSNCASMDGKLSATLKQLFDLIRENGDDRFTEKGRWRGLQWPFCELAPVTGLEPVTHRLTADCATIAPHRNESKFDLKALKSSPVLSYCQ